MEGGEATLPVHYVAAVVEAGVTAAPPAKRRKAVNAQRGAGAAAVPSPPPAVQWQDVALNTEEVIEALLPADDAEMLDTSEASAVMRGKERHKE